MTVNDEVIEISSSSEEEEEEQQQEELVGEEREEEAESEDEEEEEPSSLPVVRCAIRTTRSEEREEEDKEEEVILIDSDDDEEEDKEEEEKQQQQQQQQRFFNIGTEVLIHNILSKPELNGTKGEIMEYTGGFDRRYSVKVFGNVLALKEVNLIDFNTDGERAMEVMLQIRAAENRDGDDDTNKKRKEMMENEEDNVMLPTHRNDDVYGEDDDESPLYRRMAPSPPPSESPPARRMVPPPSPSAQFTPTRSKYARTLPYAHPAYQSGKSKMFGKITCVLDHDFAIKNVGKAVMQGLDAPNGISGVSKDYKNRLRCTSRTLLPIPASITWIRHPEKELRSNEECRFMLQDLTQMQVEEDPRLYWSMRTTLVLNGEEFVKLLEKEEETERLQHIQDGSLSDVLLKAKRRSDSVGILTLLVYGLDDYVLKRTRKEMAQVGAKDAFNDKFVSAMKTKLIVRSGGFGNLGKIQVKVVECLNEQAVVDNIIGMHRWLADLPFKKNHNAISVGVVATADEKKIKKLDHLNVSWVKALAAISGLAEEHAHVVANRFSSAKKLIEHFERYKDDRYGGEHVIADLNKFSNRHRDGRQKIGIGVAQRLRVMFSQKARAGDIL
ncbi:unnamed protein product [Bathycoccus prasinos]